MYTIQPDGDIGYALVWDDGWVTEWLTHITDEPFARRIAAALNAVQSIPTSALETGKLISVIAAAQAWEQADTNRISGDRSDAGWQYINHCRNEADAALRLLRTALYALFAQEVG